MVAQQYSFEEAYDLVMDLKDKVGGHMPYHEDYGRYGYGDGLALALALDKNAERDMKRLGVRPFAVVNIAVVREQRRRNGEPVLISQSWETGNSNLFENK